MGPEWRILAQGDLYGTGVETVVAYWPSGAVSRPQLPARYAGFTTAADQVVVVQRNPAGQPWVRVQISLAGLFFNGDNRNPVLQPGLPDSRTIAMAVALASGSAPIRIVPLDSAGRPVAEGLAVCYEPSVDGMVIAPLVLPGDQRPALLGAEWTILAQGDLYGSGVETAIGYSRSGMEPARADLPPAYVGYTTTLERLVVVQRNPVGQPFVRVLVSPGGVFVDGQSSPVPVPGGPNSRTQGFALAHDHPSAPLRLVPLDTQGRPVETGFEIRPAPARAGFELVALPTPGDQPVWPGPEWQVAHQVDFNGDGLNEQIYVLPSTVVPDEATFYRPAYRDYHWVAREALIIQAQGGGRRVLAAISPDEVRSERVVLATLAGASGRPAAFFLAAPLDGATPLAAIPLDDTGKGYAQGFGLRWDPAAGEYRLVIGPGAPQPQPQPEPQPTTAVVSDFVGFPAGGVPPMTVYAVDAQNPHVFYAVSTGLNMPAFTLRLPAGTYYLLAYTDDPSMPATAAGAYTEYIRCGERIECTDHSLVALTVSAGQRWGDILIRDWAFDGSFPARPQGTPLPQP